MNDEGSTPRRTQPLDAEADAAPPALELSRGTSVGRYLIVEPIGKGGMGVVYGAYDPELNRKVAIKVLHRTGAGDQARMRREAQAMARLQHPNVVAVYDVGLFDDRVFVAMELVDGTTLAAWLDEAPRPWRDSVEALVQAGRGLAAAHAVGLVHRDFKLANVLRGHDGRVRVVDFGVARSLSHDGSFEDADGAPLAGSAPLDERITRTGALLGTPGYISPEHFLGLSVDARSDQFSFCVALYRALYREAPFAGESLEAIADEVTHGRLRPPPKDTTVPPRLRDVVLRGLSFDPEQRWPSMPALLEALALPVHSRRRRLWMATGALAVTGILVGAVLIERRRDRVCSGGHEAIAAVWNDARKSAVHTAFVATGAPFAEDAFAGAARAFDRFAAGWESQHADACRATHVRHEQSSELLDLRMACLGQRLEQARAQIDVMTSADRKVVEQAVEAASSLEDLAACHDATALRAPMPPPRDAATAARVDGVRRAVAHAQALDRAGKYDEALAIATSAVEAARPLAYRPLEASTLFTLGAVQLARGDIKPAAQTLEEAALAARAGRDTPTEVDALTLQSSAASSQARWDDAYAFGRRGVAAFSALGGTDEEPLAVLYGLMARPLRAQARYDEAFDSHRRALVIRERLFGPDSYKVSYPLRGMAQVLTSQGKYAEAEPLARRALAIAEKELGKEHPDTGYVVNSLGAILWGEGHYEEALAAFRRVDDIWSKTLPPTHPNRMTPLNNIGEVLNKLGRYDEAVPYERRALALAEKRHGPEHPETAVPHSSLGESLRMQGKLDEAMTEYARAVAIREHALGAEHPDLAMPLTGMALVELARNQPARALPLAERALAIGVKHPGDAVELAETKLALARASWDAHRDRAAAHRLAVVARDAFVAAGEKAARDRGDADRWLAAHPAP